MDSGADAKAAAPEGSSLSRKELQSFLKAWGCKATGTNDSLRTSYEAARNSFAGTNANGEDLKVSAKPKPAKEKRLKRYRPKATSGILQRIARARTQRLYLVQRSEVKEDTNESSCDFVVLGSTGNVYDVTISKLPSCSCPDHGKGNLCKHILFVMLKVVGLDRDSPLVFQAAYLQSELNEIFSCMARRRVGGSVMANSNVKQAYASLQKGESPDTKSNGVERRSIGADSDCPICFDSMSGGSQNLTFCKAACGTNFHEDCIKRWLRQNRANATCPNCRQPWLSNESPTKSNREGFTNLGALQGQSQERDDGTYSDWYHGSSWYKRRRGYY